MTTRSEWVKAAGGQCKDPVTRPDRVEEVAKECALRRSASEYWMDHMSGMPANHQCHGGCTEAGFVAGAAFGAAETWLAALRWAEGRACICEAGEHNGIHTVGCSARNIWMEIARREAGEGGGR